MKLAGKVALGAIVLPLIFLLGPIFLLGALCYAVGMWALELLGAETTS